MDATVALAHEQPGVLQHSHVFRDRRERDVERLGKLGDRELAGGEAREHRPARGVAQRCEGRIEYGR